jgi:membrane protease YdiL (CAAX protease family)
MLLHFIPSLITSPLFEEPGWRGFALVNLQQRYGRQIGSLLVGCLWWLWHQPMNLTFGLTPSIYSFAAMVALSFMIDSLFNLSGRNVFAAMLAHQSYGTANTFLYRSGQNLAYLGLLVVFVIVLRLVEARASARLEPAQQGVED